VNAGLIDVFSIALSPVLFGSGIRLFEGVDAGRVALEPVRRGADAAGDPPDLRSPGSVCGSSGRGLHLGFRTYLTLGADREWLSGSSEMSGVGVQAARSPLAFLAG